MMRIEPERRGWCRDGNNNLMRVLHGQRERKKSPEISIDAKNAK
jgi:hypothetical protein